MKQKEIQKKLEKLLLGGRLLHLKVAGIVFEMFFVPAHSEVVSLFCIGTDASIFVGEDVSIENHYELKDENFFPQRAKAMVAIFELTGYEIESVSVLTSGALSFMLGKSNVLIIPEEVKEYTYIGSDKWYVTLTDSKDCEHGYVIFEDGFTDKHCVPSKCPTVESHKI